MRAEVAELVEGFLVVVAGQGRKRLLVQFETKLVLVLMLVLVAVVVVEEVLVGSGIGVGDIMTVRVTSSVRSCGTASARAAKTAERAIEKRMVLAINVDVLMKGVCWNYQSVH